LSGGFQPARTRRRASASPVCLASLCDLWSLGSFHRPISPVLGSSEELTSHD
jgi:hypothetical protein